MHRVCYPGSSPNQEKIGMKRLAVTFTLLAAVTLLGGCATQRYQEDPKDVDLIEVSYKATTALLTQTKKPLQPNSMVLVSTFVNVDELAQTESFGRILSSQIASAFNNAGYRIRPIELPTEIFVKEDRGLLKLSDETRRVLKATDASALVVGVFAPGKRTAYVSLRMVDVESETVIATTDFSVPMGPDAKVLLQPRPAVSKKP